MVRLLLVISSLVICLATPALAYVGPGPGMGMLSSLFTLIGGVVLALLMVLLYPLRLLYKRIRNKKNTPTSSE